MAGGGGKAQAQLPLPRLIHVPIPLSTGMCIFCTGLQVRAIMLSTQQADDT